MSLLRLFILFFIVVIGTTPMGSSVAGTQNQKKRKRKPRQYKRVHQKYYRQILSGKIDQAVTDMETFLKQYPDDEETHYMMAVARVAQGDLESAMASMRTAIEKGLPVQRFIGGTKTGLKKLESHPEFQKIKAAANHQLVHGPMLGCMTGDSVKVWVRTVGAQSVVAEFSRTKDFQNKLSTSPIKSSKKSDFTAVMQIQGLAPNQEYFYRVRIDDGQPGKTHRFRTLAARDQPVRFRLAFGGGAGYVPENERAWNTILWEKPDVLVLLGDNVYIDDPKSPAMQHYCYYRRQSRPEYRKLIGSAPVFSIWDDHDFGTNDCQGGPAIDTPNWKRPVYQVFRNNWVNPYYGGGDSHPGCNYDFYLGDIHFIMLDGRYYRDLKKSRKQRSSMLGPVQMTWLKKTLKGSRGKLKVICSPVPWVFRAKGDSRDTWNGFKEERNEIFAYLTQNKIGGVFLMSADRHRSDLWKIDRPGDYPLYELNSSRLTNQHVHPEMAHAIFSYNKKQSFGTVDFDTTVSPPTVRYRVVNIDGKQVFDKTLAAAQP